MAIVWFIVLAIIAAFAVFAGESTMRMRNDIKVIREAVLDTRKKVVLLSQQQQQGKPDAADEVSPPNAAVVESFNDSRYV